MSAHTPHAGTPRPATTTPPRQGPTVRDPADDIVSVTLHSDTDTRLLRFVLITRTPAPLRRMLPALQSMDLEVLHEQTSIRRESGDANLHVHDLTVQPGTHATHALADNHVDAGQRIRATFEAIWNGLAEADRFNGLVLSADLNWQQVSLIRSYSRYLRQLPLPYSQSRIQTVLLDNPAATRALLAHFAARFDPTSQATSSTQRTRQATAAARTLNRAIEAIIHIDADRILRAYRNLIDATVRTNTYTHDALTPSTPYLVHKFAATIIDELPHPRPVSEIFVYAPEFEGVHLRFGLIARGGLRWSDRHDDYRTEVLGLVRAQMVKNAVIVPAGAKGVFVVKSPSAQRHNIEEQRPIHQQARQCYEHFVAALLDVVDNTAPGHDAPNQHVARHDEPDHYLVVAADKGTATFSDLANAVSRHHHYWLDDAFASGGSAGYDHKAMGITARGAWVSGDAHLQEVGIDAHHDAFTAVGIGDMSGDVFGNGMLLRPHMKLIAAFDHRHIFLDPTPMTDVALAERRRLFSLARSSWADYDQTSLSNGGGVWPRTTKTIPLSPQIRQALGLADTHLTATPDELIAHILRAPVDLLFNGGVGTYVKAAHEQHSEVADKVNDAVRVSAPEVRARVIVEGGNLGVSPKGRIEFARAGGLIYSDAIDNAAGVDCSDHEVNIKIALQPLTRHTPADRGGLLARMTADVAELVLANNKAHTRLLSDARSNAPQMAEVHARMTAFLEHSRGLNRERDNLPSEDEFVELVANGDGLTGPQLATLMAHAKLDLKTQLLATDNLDADHFADTLNRYFPAELHRYARQAISDHPLRREIIATSVVNNVVATSGLTYAHRLSEEIGATTGDIVRAHAIVSSVFDLTALWDDIHAARLGPTLTNTLIIESRRLLDRASRWFLRNRPQPLDVTGELQRFQNTITTLRKELPHMLCGAEAQAATAVADDLTGRGAPSAIATTISHALYDYSLLDIVDAALLYGQDPHRLALTYFELSAHIGVDDLLLAVSALPRTGRWHSLARLALREDLYRSLRDVALDVCRRSHPSPDPVSTIDDFQLISGPRIRRARRTLDEFRDLTNPDLAAVSVATAQLRRLTTVA
ncbi:NAD-glutamate dehydrogenase [Mycolicibacterium sp. 018/SC-01/001]|uniref:NAD-glutamate dehydrogenase domain-containing protein n=1 Tax=Mycolicibacterium sp. 018/SC-01/001 TaxID=2592069 RepID=UPI00117C42AD|nr:NAD-glutamate dehydrogenase domain-containing protein [Mycolicibacterium sp. 018/SC-01/001]TRW80983.1 NAD-glutamate dehydrogenase [Mycolicibacterium sp. 018/SC-01/001]